MGVLDSSDNFNCMDCEKNSTNEDNVIKKQDSALEILKQRYAKGEIDKQEFEQKRIDLGE